MPVTSFVADDLFIVRVLKHHQFNPDRVWANSYEFRASAGGDEGDLLTLAEKLVDFEAAMTYDLVTFNRVLISTWAPDSVPYDPAAFISSPLTAVGIIPSEGGELLPINQCLDIRRFPSTGRYGHVFLRAALTEGDVHAPAGTSVLLAPLTLNSRLLDAVEDSGFGEYVGVGDGALKLVMVNADGTQVRLVNQLRVGGVATLPTDHAWFNRSSITVP